MKTCARCKEELPLEAFGVRKSRPDGRQSYCKECSKAYATAHYRRNKPEYLARNRRQRDKVGDLIREFKTSNPCADCGLYYPYFVMDFDHLPEFEKLFELADAPRRKGIKATEEEMAKCELVCANCHRMRTFDRAA